MILLPNRLFLQINIGSKSYFSFFTFFCIFNYNTVPAYDFCVRDLHPGFGLVSLLKKSDLR